MTAEVIALHATPAAEPVTPPPDPQAILAYLKGSRMYHTYTALRLRRQIRSAEFFDGDDKPVKQWKEWFSHHVAQVRRYAKAERKFKLAGQVSYDREMARS